MLKLRIQNKLSCKILLFLLIHIASYDIESHTHITLNFLKATSHPSLLWVYVRTKSYVQGVTTNNDINI